MINVVFLVQSADDSPDISIQLVHRVLVQLGFHGFDGIGCLALFNLLQCKLDQIPLCCFIWVVLAELVDFRWILVVHFLLLVLLVIVEVFQVDLCLSCFFHLVNQLLVFRNELLLVLFLRQIFFQDVLPVDRQPHNSKQNETQKLL